MKKPPASNSLYALAIRLGLVIAALLCGVTASYATPAPPPIDSYTNSFDTDATSAASWIYWYGWNPGNSAVVWDGTKDAAGNAASGSLLVNLPMDGNNQQVFFGTFQNTSPYSGGIVYDAAGYFTNIEFDILVDPALSITNPATGDFGVLYVTLVGSGTPNGGGPFVNNVTIPAAASNGWVHLTLPVQTGQAFFTDPGVIGVVFKMDSFGGSTYRIGHTNQFWIDNLSVKFSGAPPPPPPPPTITSITKPLKNLNFYTTGSDYGRSSIRSLGTAAAGAQYTWYNVATSGNPVSYSFTVTGYPGAGHAGYHSYIYLVPYPLVGSGDNNIAADYQEPTVVYLSLDLDAAGAATYTFRWKTNILAGNGAASPNNLVNHFYDAPHESIGAATALGTWTCTFSNNVNCTLTAPGGASTNFNIPAGLAAAFNSPILFYFGVRPDTANTDKGEALAISNLSIQGATTTFSDSFTDGSALDTVTAWEFESANGGNPSSEIFVTPLDYENGFIISWPQLNASGYNLQTNSVLGNTNSFPWSTNGLPAASPLGVGFKTFLSTNDVDVKKTRFFRLAKPGF